MIPVMEQFKNQKLFPGCSCKSDLYNHNYRYHFQVILISCPCPINWTIDKESSIPVSVCQENSVKIVMVGDSGVGKSCLLGTGDV